MMITILLSLALFANPSFSAEAKDAVYIHLVADPADLDPLKLGDNISYGIMSNVLESLMRIDENGVLKKGLAESYTVSKNGLNYRFKIRPDAKWSDGQAVTAEECVRGFLASIQPGSEAPLATLLAVKGARAYFEGKAKADAVGVRAGKNEVVFELEKPAAPFLNVLTTPFTSPRRAEFKNEWSPGLVSNGRYVVSSFKPGIELVLQPNPFNKVEGQQTIVFRIVSEDVAALNLFENGKLDILQSVPRGEMDRLEKDGRLIEFPSAGVTYLGFNVKKPPFDNLDWRKAVATAVQKDELETVLKYGTAPAQGYLPRALEGSLDLSKTAFMGSRTRVRESSSKPKVVMGFSSNSVNNLIAQKIQNDLRKNLGLEIELNQSEPKVYFAGLMADAPPLFLLNRSAIYNDPSAHLEAFIPQPKVNKNHSNYNNSKYTKLVAQIESEVDMGKRKKKIHQAQKILIAEDVVTIPLFERVQVFAVSKRVKGFKSNPFNVLQLDQLRL